MPTWVWVSLIVLALVLTFIVWSCIRVGSRSEQEYEEARRRETLRRHYSGSGGPATSFKSGSSNSTSDHSTPLYAAMAYDSWGDSGSGSDSGSSGCDSGGSDGGGGGCSD